MGEALRLKTAWSAVRVILTFVTAVAVFFFVYWFGSALVLPVDAPEWPSLILAFGASVLAARYVFRHSTAPNAGFFRSVLLGALVVGAVGFVGGFFGPMVLTPDANQGPLLGLFITGPLGFLAGAAGGAIYWLVRGQRASP